MSPPRPACLLIEGCDFERFPPGGQLSSAKQMMAAFGNRLALVGICTDRTPVGRWIERAFGAERFLFYGVGHSAPSSDKPLVPARLAQYLRLTLHRKGILSLGVRAAFLQAPEALLVVSRWGLDSVCYRFPGVENPLSMPRYQWGRVLAGWFDRRLFDALARTDVILASADDRAIDALVARSGGSLPRNRVCRLPTQFDSAIFRPSPAVESQRGLGLDLSSPLVVSVGRLNRVKGWDLLLESFKRLAETHRGAQLVFVGDGEDRSALLARVSELELADRVTVTGFLEPSDVAAWLNAADVVAVGSHKEGWSVAMLEALGCGKAIVSTDVSGARDMIREGENGFVVRTRDPEAHAEAIRRALLLRDAQRVSVEIASRYGLDSIGQIGKLWKVLA
jgi:glycosyltransferase involved in cell wall biosynthesis